MKNDRLPRTEEQKNKNKKSGKHMQAQTPQRKGLYGDSHKSRNTHHCESVTDNSNYLLTKDQIQETRGKASAL